MVSLYYSFIYSYLNYGNITWCSMSITKHKKLASKQKQAPQTSPILNSFIYSYLNYGNITWCSMSITKHKKLASKQKQAPQTSPILTSESELCSKQIMKELFEYLFYISKFLNFCILNIYQLNIYSVLNIH